jgi:hypothetical protein
MLALTDVLAPCLPDRYWSFLISGILIAQAIVFGLLAAKDLVEKRRARVAVNATLRRQS